MRKQLALTALLVAAMAGTSLGQQTPDKPKTPGTQPGSTQPGTTQPSTGQPGTTQPGRTSQPGMEGGQRQLSNAEVEQFTRGWPQDHIQVVQTMARKYGPPSEGGTAAIVWSNPGKFKKIIVYREEVDHQFPMAHKDFLETVISMRVPPDKVVDLLKFDGSLVFNRTKGTLSAICDKEENNILALNLANDIVNDSKSVEEARETFAKTAMAAKGGEKPSLMTDLQFSPVMAAADPDQPFRVLGTPESPDRDKEDLDKPKSDKPGMDKPKNSNPETPRSPTPTNPR
jgi:hypothetical protein